MKRKTATIYKSEEGRRKILALYEEQLSRIGVPYKDIYVDTSFGKTHIIETGCLSGEPIMVFHGGNATTAYNLLACGFLFERFHIYAVDIIGHPGKSAETCLSSRGYDYGRWVGEVIDALGFDKISLFGGSFGAGVMAKAMCAVPEKVKRSVMVVPSGIKNAPYINSLNMLFPMIMYLITHDEKWFRKTLMPIAVYDEANITEDLLRTSQTSIDNVKVKTAMPSSVSAEKMRRCKAPTLVMAAEKDCLFPGAGVLYRAKCIIPNCKRYLLRGRGHVNTLTAKEQQMIVDFLL